jgi:(R,R)-butanediol dehydrogenase/meso-butanediol dehydrogenase/diacetyl reductase
MLPGAFAEYIHAPAYIVHPLPEGMPLDTGALVEPLAVTVHGLRQAGLSGGERVAIIGAGTIGLMALVGAKAMGASDVFVTARYPHQAEAARALGATHVVDAAEGAVVKLSELFAGRSPEVVVETVGGNGETLNQAISIAQAGGRISVLGIFTGQASVNMTVAVLKEVQLLGGIVYGRRKGQSDFELALAIAAQRSEDMRRIITHRVGLDDIERGFAIAADKSQRSIKVTVEM